MKALFPLRLFPNSGYYAAMFGCSEVAFDIDAPYRKADKDTHRFEIADTRGPLRLTVPVAVPHGARRWADVTISDHGRWYETMPIALESAYGRTPYFEFYIDRFAPLFNDRSGSVVDLCLRADAIIRKALYIPAHIVAPQADMADLRTFDFHSIPLPHYWQVRADSLGFIGGLSILDILFNLGPDAAMLLFKSSQNLSTQC